MDLELKVVVVPITEADRGCVEAILPGDGVSA